MIAVPGHMATVAWTKSCRISDTSVTHYFLSESVSLNGEPVRSISNTLQNNPLQIKHYPFNNSVDYDSNHKWLPKAARTLSYILT